MGKYYKWNELLCKELEEEMSKFEKEPTDKRLERVEKLIKSATGLQELEAAGAMRKYFEEEKGYDSMTGEFEGYRNRQYPSRMIYNAARRMTPVYPDWDMYDDEYRMMEEYGIMDAGRRSRDSRGRYNRYDDMMYNRGGNGGGSRGSGSSTGGRGGSYGGNRGGGRYNDGRYNDGDEGGMGYRIYNHGDAKEAYRKRKLTKEEYKEWMDEMQHADGGTGEMFTTEETSALAKKIGLELDEKKKIVFCVAMNMMYSDYCEVAEKFNVNKPEFYACMAKAFLEDEDSIKWGEKLSAYYNAVVEK